MRQSKAHVRGNASRSHVRDAAHRLLGDHVGGGFFFLRNQRMYANAVVTASFQRFRGFTPPCGHVARGLVCVLSPNGV